jgi:DNA polymerase I-like protein with 3'-5' exonuclease and polymerase domains
MLINCDIKSLELVTAAYLSRDPVLIRELVAVSNVMRHFPGDKGKMDAVDPHTLNQLAFGLPERRIAKIFIFRLIYGGSAVAYTLDPDFNWISKKVSFWQDVIDKTYKKYAGLGKWHTHLVQIVTLNSKIVMPTGREYSFSRYLHPRHGWTWPRTKILNYPVQGLGAELVKLARILFMRRLHDMDPRILLCSSVHDSLVVDTPREFLYTVMCTLRECIEAVPVFFKAEFGIPFDLPLMCEIQYGPNKFDMEEWNGSAI